MRRGTATGQLRDDLDVRAIVDMLAATAYYRLLITGAPLDPRAAKRHADVLVACLTAR